METQRNTLLLTTAAIALSAGATAVLGQTNSVGQTEEQEPQSERYIQSEQRREAQEEEENAAPNGSQQSVSSAGEIDRLAQEHDNLTAFVEALKETGMADALTDGTAYIVFAPTNEAFEAADSSNHEELVSLLRAHIVADDVDLQTAQLPAAQTIDGGSVVLQNRDGALMVGEARVVEPRIDMGSLHVYVIDQTLQTNAPREYVSLTRADEPEETQTR